MDQASVKPQRKDFARGCITTLITGHNCQDNFTVLLGKKHDFKISYEKGGALSQFRRLMERPNAGFR